MLNIIETTNCTEATIEIDEYIPFSIEFASKNPSSLAYWRAGDGNSSLMEVGLDENSGAIKSVTLTSINPKNVNRVDDLLSRADSDACGIPICDMEKWFALGDSREFSENFVDEFELDISLNIGRSHISVLLCKDCNPKYNFENLRC